VEVDHIRDALQSAEQRGLCHVHLEPNATVDRVLRVFRDDRYRNRIVIFHYAGHADEERLLQESPSGAYALAHAQGLAAFLGQQMGLQLVFLNGCSTAGQRGRLIEANCAAVIVTSRSIDDEVAMEFAANLYAQLGRGDGLKCAFDKAVEGNRTKHGDNPRTVHWEPRLNRRRPTIGRGRSRPGRVPRRCTIGTCPMRRTTLCFGLPPLRQMDLPDSPTE
jgi:hypothetical protein